MAFEGEIQAVQRVGPAPASNSTALNKSNRTATSTTASAAIPIPGTGNGQPGCWVTLKPLTTDAYVVFGGADVAAPVAANDIPFFAGSAEDVWCQSGITHFRVISTGGGGSLAWYRSSL